MDYNEQQAITIIKITNSKDSRNGYIISLPRINLTINNDELAFEYKDGKLIIREVDIDDVNNIRSIRHKSLETIYMSFRIPSREEPIILGEYPIDDDETNEYTLVVYCKDEDRIIK